MLKQFLKMSAMLFALLAMVTGCVHVEGASAETEDYEYEEQDICYSFVRSLWFDSLEEFLNTYIAAREGRVSTDSRNPEHLIESTNFTSFDTIHLLTNIPKAYQIVSIRVRENAIDIMYVANGNSSVGRYFLFQVGYFTHEDWELSGIKSHLDTVMHYLDFTEEDLIDEKYLFDTRWNTLYWEEGSISFSLEIPMTAHQDHTAPHYSINDILRFAKTITIDLQDENNIAAWSAGDFSAIEELLSVTTPALRFTIGRNDFRYNGAIRQAEAAPFISQGRTMIPLRVIAEALGAEVDWDEDTRTVMITARGETFKLDDMGIIVNGRTFVPVRYVSETLGAAVRWDEANKTVYIY
jgi:hypothetical protein